MFDCLLFSNLVDGPTVHMAPAMCWFNRINYYFSSLVSCHLSSTQYAPCNLYCNTIVSISCMSK